MPLRRNARNTPPRVVRGASTLRRRPASPLAMFTSPTQVRQVRQALAFLRRGRRGPPAAPAPRTRVLARRAALNRQSAAAAQRRLNAMLTNAINNAYIRRSYRTPTRQNSRVARWSM